jgi:hypothetical protein
VNVIHTRTNSNWVLLVRAQFGSDSFFANQIEFGWIRVT